MSPERPAGQVGSAIPQGTTERKVRWEDFDEQDGADAGQQANASADTGQQAAGSAATASQTPMLADSANMFRPARRS